MVAVAVDWGMVTGESERLMIPTVVSNWELILSSIAVLKSFNGIDDAYTNAKFWFSWGINS